MGIYQANKRLVRRYNTLPNAAALSPASGKQIALRNCLIGNSAGGSNVIAILKKLSSSAFKFYREVGGGGLADLTATLSSGQAIFSGNNDRIVVGSRDIFGHIALFASVAGAGGGVYTYSYFDGTNWVPMTSAVAITTLGLGANAVTFLPPIEWVKGAPVADALSSEYYFFQIVSTTADAATITDSWAGELLSIRMGAAQNTTLSIDQSDRDNPLVLGADQSIVPMFQTADAQNYIEITYNDLE